MAYKQQEDQEKKLEKRCVSQSSLGLGYNVLTNNPRISGAQPNTFICPHAAMQCRSREEALSTLGSCHSGTQADGSFFSTLPSLITAALQVTWLIMHWFLKSAFLLLTFHWLK